jgi:uncharacterized protein (UPF0332 family)
MSPLLAKAQRALESAKLLLATGDVDGAVNRAYYAMFDAAKTVLTEGSPPLVSQPIKSHNGLITLFSQHLVKTGRVTHDLGKNLNAVEELRLIADYKAEDIITNERASWAVDAATQFVSVMTELTHRNK